MHLCIPYLYLWLWLLPYDLTNLNKAQSIFHATALFMILLELLFTHSFRWHAPLCLLWLTSMYFFVGMTVMGVWLTSLTPRAEWAATAQTPTAQSTSRQKAPTKRISPSPPTCQPLAPSTHSCRVSVFYCGSQVEQVIFKIFCGNGSAKSFNFASTTKPFSFWHLSTV